MSNIESAQKVHHQLEFYLVALAFTIVGFSLQTGSFCGSGLADTTEVLSWISMTISGLLGLGRLEYVPVLYRVYHNLVNQNTSSEKKEILSAEFKRMEKRNLKYYSWQKLFFIAGIIFLIIARCANHMKEYY